MSYPQNTPSDLVIVIEDDASIRDGLARLFRSVNLESRQYGSIAEFQHDRSPASGAACCFVLDVRLPGVSGLEFQDQLDRHGDHAPIVFMTGYGDIPMSVRAMKGGAVDFLAKPFRDQDMLDAVTAALEKDRLRGREALATAEILTRRERLTARELQVMDGVVKGQLNKQIAADLDLSEVTVKIHRGHMMRKMGARSVVELVRMIDQLKGRIASWPMTS
jgi:FixJ family two-component response regulator